MRISRPCYDKYHRCPGWNGGGIHSAKVYRCDGGYISYPENRLWKWWRFNRCPKCGVIVLPYATRYLDGSYWVRWKIPRWIGDYKYNREHK